MLDTLVWNYQNHCFFYPLFDLHTYLRRGKINRRNTRIIIIFFLFEKIRQNGTFKSSFKCKQIPTYSLSGCCISNDQDKYNQETTLRLRNKTE